MSNFPLGGVVSLLPFVTFVVLLVLQYLLPRRNLALSGSNRIIHNLLLFVVNSVLLRLLIPFTVVMAAVWAENVSVGLFNVIQFDSWLIVVICILLLDMAVYWQHVLTHKIPVLWRLHRVHHADHDMDVTTAIRFHPIELLLSLAYKSAVIVLIGAPVVAVMLFELFLFIGPAFNHSNLKLPFWLDKKLRWVIATPDMHRIHHSELIEEQNTNYGFFLVWWDRMFGSYTEQPVAGHSDMKIGLAQPEPAAERVDEMLLMPFR